MKFVVLVAGVGSRLRPLTNDRPKCLVQVNGKSILERLLEQAENTRLFAEAVLITGYRAEAVRQFAERWKTSHSLPVTLIHNERYDETNNGYSLWCAKDVLTSSFVLSDGDLTLDDEILQLIAQHETSALAIDRSARLDEEAMKISVSKEGHVNGLSKELPLHQAVGESIGMCRIDAVDIPKVISELDKLVENQEWNEYYERAFIELIQNGWQVDVCDIGGRAWVEIDDRSDLQRAEENFSTET
ncbi:phosphocholine cytidylyltransferase family protein [Fodinisporobacter ferrooxydans]|uniref:Phosphocholine cytidylyltransferase family protein n=1 Tax=Fodinisporobacter ferrooxydans TaxID=2901836 RepID=A0ABY4CIY6_9BACL|nr:phosphocholine cytidylyltransferase family protein [Alicyclobacillaceae bacterium MYW30-H2]